jgi:hypothetical protein
MKYDATMPRRIGRVLILGGFLVVLGLYYLWMPGTFHRHWLDDRPVGIYNELSDALLSGQLSLKRQPDPRITALADPYDPKKNADFRINDLSYFNGHYFAYMGPAPAVVLFMPVRLLTGRFLHQDAAAPLFLLLGAAASIVLLFHVGNSLLPASPFGVRLICVVALVLGDGYYVADRGAIAQQVAVAAAYAFGMLFLMACSYAATTKIHLKASLAAASLVLGLAIASRPNYVFAVFAFGPVLLFRLRDYPARRSGEMWSLVLVATTPLALILVLLLGYNQSRFGHSLDFGQRYILGAWSQINMSNSGMAFGWQNAWHYLFAPALYSAYFPFVSAPTWLAVSIGPHVPWLWLTPLAAWALFRRGAGKPVNAIGATVLILSAANMLTLIFLPSGNPAAILTSANARYLLDFQPGFALFVALGLLAVFEPGAVLEQIRKWIVVPLAASLAVATAVIALSLDFGVLPSASYRKLAEVLDLPAYVMESARGDSYGPLSTMLLFPSGRNGAFEPLVSTGSADACDLLYVHYVSPTEIRFGLVGTGFMGPESDPISVAYGEPHLVIISMGSLFPPSAHPRLARFSESQVAFLKHNLRVTVDGRIAMDLPAYFHSSSPGEVRLGHNPFLQGYSGPDFTGRILSSQRLPLVVSEPTRKDEPLFGPVQMRFQLPETRPHMSREPLLVTGVSGAGDLVYIQYFDGDIIRLGLDHWGSPGIESGPIHAANHGEHTIKITMGALFPAGHFGPLTQHVRILFDGHNVLDADQDTYDSSPYDVAFGVNAIGGSTCGYQFTGRILAIERSSSDQ